MILLRRLVKRGACLKAARQIVAHRFTRQLLVQ